MSRLEPFFNDEDTRVLGVGRFLGDLVHVDLATGAEPLADALIQEAQKRGYALVMRLRESGELTFGTPEMSERFARATEARSKDPGNTGGAARRLPQIGATNERPADARGAQVDAAGDAFSAALGRIERARDHIDEKMFVLLPDIDRLVVPNTVAAPRVQAILRQAGALFASGRGNARSRMVVFAGDDRAREVEGLIQAHDFGASPWREVRPGPPDKNEIARFLERVAARHELGGNIAATAKLLAQRQQSLAQIATALRARIDNGESDVASLVAGEYDEAEVQRVWAELDQLVGLEQVKAKLTAIVKSARNVHAALQRGENVDAPSIHMALLGRPGTGKTEVAGIIARMLHAAGLRRRDTPVKAGLADLASEFNPGEVVQKMQRLINQAAGGVLFIDEAYALAEGVWGEGAVTTLVDEMEKRRADFTVLLAGYPDRMEKLFAMNAGLRSRISDTNVIQLRDYSADELCEIANRMMAGRKVQVMPEARAAAHAIIRREATRPHANGREVRNLVESWDAVRIARDGSQFEVGDIVDPRTASRARADELLAEFDRRFLGAMQVRTWLENIALVALDALARGRLQPAPRIFFQGPPGTGKTETARFVGQFLKAVGVLRDGRVKEVSLQHFTSSVRGGAAEKTQTLFEENKECVLFIDEAYRLAESGDGQEVLHQIVQHTTDKEFDSVCVVMAGYGQQMRELARTNPGLDSRFATKVEFVWPDDADLVAIARRKLEKDHGLHPSDDVAFDVAMQKALRGMRASDGFAGARSAIGLADKVRVNALAARRPAGECAAADVPDLAADVTSARVAALLASFRERFIDREGLEEIVKRTIARRVHHLKELKRTLGFEVIGEPGTGKTSLVEWLMDAFASLSPGVAIPRARRTALSLKGQHVGVTENLVREAFRSAVGGFLFIDDAHALVGSGQHSDVYDTSAIKTIIEQMRAPENARTTLFLAGQPALARVSDELRGMLAQRIEVPVPSSRALARITLRGLQKAHPIAGAAPEIVEPLLEEYFERRRRGAAFANAREAEKLADDIRAEAFMREFQEGPVAIDDIVKVVSA